MPAAPSAEFHFPENHHRNTTMIKQKATPDDEFDDLEDSVQDEDLDGGAPDEQSEDFADEDFNEEEWDEESAADEDGEDTGESDDGAAEEQSKGKKGKDAGGKKKSSLGSFIIILAALGGLGFVALQFLGGGAAPTASTAPEQMAAADNTPPQPFPSQPAEPEAVVTPVQEPAPEIPALATAEPQPSALPAMPDTGMPPQPVEVQGQAPMPVPDALTPLPGGMADTPVGANLPKAQDILLEKPAAVPAAELAALTGKLDAMLGRLDQFESRIADLEKTVTEGGMAAPAESADVSGLQEQLGQMRDRLAALEKRPAAAAPKAEKLAEKPPVKEKEPEAAVPAPAEKAPAAPKPKKEPTPVAAAPAPVKAEVPWILRAAQPGEAMVSRGVEGEMSPVRVGDQLPGIGKVLSIGNETGRWVVQGSTGRISN